MTFGYEADLPQMFLDARTPPAEPRALPRGVSVRIVGAGDRGLASVLAAVRIAYGDAGTVASLAGELTADGTVAETAESIRYGRRIVAGAFGAGGEALAGAHCGVDGEVHTVGTLSRVRRAGLAYEVTRVVIGEARGRGQRDFRLTAETPAAERLYAALGFRAASVAG
ncbi:hypothetical protein SRB5_27690 [Streptomyces sp. RB5]|uniref:GCN5-related N-acetyltransferase Rv2170-like domain-containing protein n=1 Tax=Streptomyces smaragdinus TaxID=2585196 RepID=A0A7K0CGY4_9ACTN|nr:GNAT family N-acetyltransferase [Streptomyces smaragdinus]MQY12633.1 hypothetical protein [Streptomyces smaragdinus]